MHLTPERNARRITRSGISARGRHGGHGVYCMAMLPSFTLTHQWVRELRRSGVHTIIAVHIRIPDDEPVTVGHYGQTPRAVTAAEAVAVIRALADPRGYEIVVPRSIRAHEIRSVRRVPQGVGWRYYPDAHGRRPCTCPMCLLRGEFGAANLRRRFPL